MLILQKFKNGEKYLGLKKFEDEDFKIMQSFLPVGGSIGYHAHEEDMEIIYVLQGSALATYDGKEERLNEGDCHYCPQGHSHGIFNDGEREFIMFAIVPKRQ